MAEDDLNYIEQELRLRLILEGVENVEAAMAFIKRSYQGLLNDVQKMTQQYGSVEDAISHMLYTYKEQARAGTEVSRKQIKQLTKLNDAVLLVDRSFSRLVGATGGLVFPTSLKGAAESTVQYDKALLQASAGVNRLGIGLVSLEGTLIRAADATSLTRAETSDLFEQFQQNMRFVSLSTFENMLSRIQGIVGSNSKAINALQGAVTSLSASFPGLADQLANIDRYDKSALATRVRNLYLIGKIGQEQYRSLAAYISGNEQALGADRQRQKEMEEHIRTMQEFKRQVEVVGLAFGQAILPYAKRITDFIEKAQDSTIRWERAIRPLVGAFAALKASTFVLGTLQTFSGISASLFKGRGKDISLLGGGGTGRTATDLARAGGGIGGITGTGTLGRPVHVWVDGWTAIGAGPMTPGTTPGGGATVLPVGKGATPKVTGMEKFLSKGALPTIIIGTLVSAGGEYVAGRYEEKGEYRKAGAAELAGAGGTVAAGIGTGALLGAGIGTAIFPGIGTGVAAAVGAALGGVTAIFGEWKDITYGVKNLLDVGGAATKRQEAEAKAAKQYDEELKQAETRTKRKESLDKEIERYQRADIGREIEATREITEAMKQAASELKAAKEDVMEKAVKQVESKFGIKIEGGGKELENYLAQQKEKIKAHEDALQRYGSQMTDKEKKLREEILKITKEQVNEIEKVVDQTAETDVQYRKVNEQVKILESRLASITDRQRVLVEVAESLSQLYQSQVGYVDSLVQRLALAGDLDREGAFKAVDETLAVLDEEIKKREEIREILQSNNKAKSQELLNSQLITDETKDAIRAANEHGQVYLDLLVVQKQLLDNDAAINEQINKRTQVLQSMQNLHKYRLESVQLEAQRASQLVELADNYAIGVGASVKMRLAAFQAEASTIEELRQKLKTNQMELQRQGNTEARNLALLNEKKQIQIDILSAMQKQAKTVRAMRDGWVSAISAMNTAAGGFTEIIMNAEQNTAQIMRLEGAIRTSWSGAFAQRDAKGRVVEDIGFMNYERFSPGGVGNITARGRKPDQLAYLTEAEKRMGLTREKGIRSLELGERGRVEKLIEGMSDQIAYTTQNNLETLGVTGNEMIKSSVVAAGKVITEARQASGAVESTTVDKMGMKEDVEEMKRKSKEGLRYRGKEAKGISTDISSATIQQMGQRIKEAIESGKKDISPVWVVNLKEIRQYLRDVSVDMEMNVKESVAEIEAVGGAASEASSALKQIGDTKQMAQVVGQLEEFKKEREIPLKDIIVPQDTVGFLTGVDKIQPIPIDSIRMNQKIIGWLTGLQNIYPISFADVKTVGEAIAVLEGAEGKHSIPFREIVVPENVVGWLSGVLPSYEIPVEKVETLESVIAKIINIEKTQEIPSKKVVVPDYVIGWLSGVLSSYPIELSNVEQIDKVLGILKTSKDKYPIELDTIRGPEHIEGFFSNLEEEYPIFLDNIRQLQPINGWLDNIQPSYSLKVRGVMQREDIIGIIEGIDKEQKINLSNVVLPKDITAYLKTESKKFGIEVEHIDKVTGVIGFLESISPKQSIEVEKVLVPSVNAWLSNLKKTYPIEVETVQNREDIIGVLTKVDQYQPIEVEDIIVHSVKGWLKNIPEEFGIEVDDIKTANNVIAILKDINTIQPIPVGQVKIPSNITAWLKGLDPSYPIDINNVEVVSDIVAKIKIVQERLEIDLNKEDVIIPDNIRAWLKVLETPLEFKPADTTVVKSLIGSINVLDEELQAARKRVQSAQTEFDRVQALASPFEQLASASQKAADSLEGVKESSDKQSASSKEVSRSQDDQIKGTGSSATEQIKVWERQASSIENIGNVVSDSLKKAELELKQSMEALRKTESSYSDIQRQFVSMQGYSVESYSKLIGLQKKYHEVIQQGVKMGLTLNEKGELIRKEHKEEFELGKMEFTQKAKASVDEYNKAVANVKKIDKRVVDVLKAEKGIETTNKIEEHFGSSKEKDMANLLMSVKYLKETPRGQQADIKESTRILKDEYGVKSSEADISYVLQAQSSIEQEKAAEEMKVISGLIVENRDVLSRLVSARADYARLGRMVAPGKAGKAETSTPPWWKIWEHGDMVGPSVGRGEEYIGDVSTAGILEKERIGLLRNVEMEQRIDDGGLAKAATEYARFLRTQYNPILEQRDKASREIQLLRDQLTKILTKQRVDPLVIEKLVGTIMDRGAVLGGEDEAKRVRKDAKEAEIYSLIKSMDSLVNKQYQSAKDTQIDAYITSLSSGNKELNNSLKYSLSSFYNSEIESIEKVMNILSREVKTKTEKGEDISLRELRAFLITSIGKQKGLTSEQLETQRTFVEDVIRVLGDKYELNKPSPVEIGKEKELIEQSKKMASSIEEEKKIAQKQLVVYNKMMRIVEYGNTVLTDGKELWRHVVGGTIGIEEAFTKFGTTVLTGEPEQGRKTEEDFRRDWKLLSQTLRQDIEKARESKDPMELAKAQDKFYRAQEKESARKKIKENKDLVDRQKQYQMSNEWSDFHKERREREIRQDIELRKRAAMFTRDRKMEEAQKTKKDVYEKRDVIQKRTEKEQVFFKNAGMSPQEILKKTGLRAPELAKMIEQTPKEEMGLFEQNIDNISRGLISGLSSISDTMVEQNSFMDMKNMGLNKDGTPLVPVSPNIGREAENKGGIVMHAADVPTEETISRRVIPHEAAVPEEATRIPDHKQPFMGGYTQSPTVVNVTMPNTNLNFQFKNLNEFKTTIIEAVKEGMTFAIAESVKEAAKQM